MSLIITSLYSAYNSYTKTDSDTPKKVKDLVGEMESRLNKLPPGKKKIELETHIKSIKIAGRANAVKNNLDIMGIHAIGIIGSFIVGPIGPAIAVYVTHDTQEKIENDQKSIIKKASIKAGKRRAETQVKQKTTSAIKAAAFTAISSFAFQLVADTSLVVRGYNYSKSCLFG